jgi:hypothetical protein
MKVWIKDKRTFRVSQTISSFHPLHEWIPFSGASIIKEEFASAIQLLFIIVMIMFVFFHSEDEWLVEAAFMNKIKSSASHLQIL